MTTGSKTSSYGASARSSLASARRTITAQGAAADPNASGVFQITTA